jgi:hypothetical protein
MFAIPRRLTFGACAAAALLCSCSGGGSPALGLLHQSGGVRDAGRSWMAPDAKKHDLLYLSDESADDVYVYSWPGLELKGTLTGFDAPNGECADNAGDVFVTNEDQSEILKYAHGGTIPIKTLGDSGEYPVGCSVDSKTGDLAVTNIDTTKGGAGSVAIYPGASGMAKTYMAPLFYYYFFCGYDGRGNLFVDGTDAGSAFEFAELPRRGNAFRTITLDQTIDFPGGVQWDGQHLAIGDQEQPYVYEFAIRGSSGTLVGSTPLDNTNDVSQFWIASRKIVAPDFLNNEEQIFKYPAGGSAIKSIPNISTPIGSALSKRK